MATVFISYSRKDIEFAKQLTGELQKSDLDFWIDWEGIPPTVDWWKEIEKGIEEADTFVFIISPDSIKSEVCGEEIAHAVKNNKRIIPIVAREIEGDAAPYALAHLNWIFFRDSDDFKAAVTKLLTAIHTDYEWVKTHRRLQVKALEWERNNHEKSLLLRGKDLEEAELQLATNTSKEPYPTDLQRDYLLKSRQATDRQRRITTGISIGGIIALAALAVFGFIQAGNATRNAVASQRNASTAQAASTLAISNEQIAIKQSQIARAGELSAQSILLREKDFQLSLLLGIEAYQSSATLQSRGALMNNAFAYPQLYAFLVNLPHPSISIAFSPDGETLAATDGGTIILLDVETRQPIGQLLTEDNVSIVAFNPDGETLASVGLDGAIILWDVATHQPIGQPLTGHTDSVISVAFSPDGETLASVSQDGTIILWDVGTGQPIGQPLPGNVFSMAFSPDGETLASVSWDNTIILWDVSTRQPIGQPLTGQNIDNTIYSVAFSLDGETLASVSQDGTIILWEVGTHQPIGQPLTLNTSSGGSTNGDFVFSPDGETLASVRDYNNIILWEVATGQPIGQPLIKDVSSASAITAIAFSSDGKTLASSSCRLSGNCTGNTIILWDVSAAGNINVAKHELPALETSTGAGPVAFSPDGKTLASGNEDGTIILLDVATRQLIGQPFTGHNAQDPIYSVAFSPDGKTLAFSSGNQSEDNNDTINLFDVETHQPIGQPLKGSSTIAFSPDGKTLASVSDKNTIILWEVGTGQPIGQPLTGHNTQNYIYSVAFSPDGKTLASISDDCTIILWNVGTGQPIGQPLTLNINPVGSFYGGFAFSPDVKTLAIGTFTDVSTIILSNMATGTPIGQITLDGKASSMTFSPDGTTLAISSCGYEGYCYQSDVVLWDVAKGQLIGQLLIGYNNSSIFIDTISVAFSPDGKLLAASTNAHDSIILWDLDPQIWVENSCQRAGRNLTRAEWTQYFPNEDYRKSCDQWPLEPEAISSTPTAPP